MMRCIYVFTNIFFFQRPHLFYFIIRNETNSLSLNHIFTKGKRKNFCVNYLFLQRRISNYFSFWHQRSKDAASIVASFPRVSFCLFVSFLSLFLSTKRRKKPFQRRHGKVFLHSSWSRRERQKKTTGGRRPNDRTGGRKRWRARIATRTPG